MAYKGYEQLDTVNTKFFGKTAVFLVFLLAIIQKTITYVRYEVVNGSRIEVVDKPEYAMVWLSFLFIFLYFLLFYIKKHSFLKQTTTMLLAVVVCVEAFASTTINWVGEINDGGWASRGGYRAYVDKLEGATDEIYENDDGLFRMEHTIFRKNNDNLVANIKGISEFTSTFNQSSINFLRSLGIYTDGQTTKYINSNIFLDSLLGIKYIIGSYQDDTNGSFPGYNSVPSLYNSTNKDNGLVVYENPYALPLAFFADSEIKDYFIDGNEHSYLERINSLYSAVLGEDASIFDTCEYTVVKNSLQSYQVTEHGYTEFRKYSSQDSAYFTLVVTAERDGDIFMHLPSPWTTAATLSVNDVEFTNTLFQGENTGTVNLGYFEAGDTVRVKLSFSHHRLCIWESDYLFVQVNEEGFKNATDKLKAKGLQVESFSDSKIEGTITSDKNGSVYTTIPYDSCWKVYVDGERVETYMLTDAMLGFDISKGTHSVELKYVFSPFYTGLAVGMAGLMIFIGLCILDKKFGRRVSVPATEPIKEGAGEEETNTDSDNSHNESEEKNDLPS